MNGLFLLVFWWMFPSKDTYFLKVNVSGFPSSKGFANVALFNSSNGFPIYGKQYQGKVVSIKDGSCQVSFTGLPSGSYSVAVYHDENNNQKMDKNLFGAPTEAYGFSNNVRPVFSAPSFEECKLNLSNDRSINVIVK